MATYLRTREILEVEVSCFANYDTPSNPRPVKLITWLTNAKHQDKVETVRQESDKVKRDSIKATLPAITPSGLFSYRRSTDLIPNGHSGFIQFDIDLKDNPHIRNYADLKNQLCKLPFIAYCGLSVSGTGYWGLVPIAYPERHGQHFDALKRVFSHYRINLDEKPRNVASLRGYSYDPEGYFADKVLLFELCDTPKPAPVREFAHTIDADAERQRVEVCISEISKRGIDITSGYNYWYAIGCDLASTFGESGREYFHVLSQRHPEYSAATCDKQYTHCLRSYKDVQLKAFFGRCRDNGISWKELIPFTPNEPSERTDPLKIIQKTCTPPTYRTYKTPDQSTEQTTRLVIIPDEVLDVEFCDTYPADWDITPISTASFVPPDTRVHHPRAPLAFDAVEQLRRIQWLVIPPGVEEADHNPVLVDIPNRDELATVLGIPSDQLPLYQLHRP